jgi:D-glycero-D-manno-heptose 1,7-bisphosphate phosphatase
MGNHLTMISLISVFRKLTNKPLFSSDMKKLKNKALFLDRDGTINVEKHYVYKVEDFEFREGIFELVQDFYSRGYLIFVITNQAGIARGFYSEKDFNMLNDWMIDQFRLEGIQITKVYFCPHHPDISGECSCRKPNPGMLMTAKSEYNLDLSSSILIGDKESDIRAGLNAHVGTNYLIKESGRISLNDVIVYKG